MLKWNGSVYVGGLMILTCAIPSEIRSRFASSTEDGNCACVASTLCSIIVALFSPMFHKTVIYFRFPFGELKQSIFITPICYLLSPITHETLSISIVQQNYRTHFNLMNHLICLYTTKYTYVSSKFTPVQSLAPNTVWTWNSRH